MFSVKLTCSFKDETETYPNIMPFFVCFSDASLHKVLSDETKGWGINTLRL